MLQCTKSLTCRVLESISIQFYYNQATEKIESHSTGFVSSNVKGHK